MTKQYTNGDRLITGDNDPRQNVKADFDANWEKIDEDLKIIMEDFWGGPAERRTCKHCGTVIERAGAIKLANGKVKAAAKKATKKQAASKARAKPRTKAKSIRR